MSYEQKDKTIGRDDHNVVADQPGPLLKMSVWKRLLFAVVTIVALFVSVETVLKVLGVRPVLYDEDPYVGFSSYIPLFVEQTEPNGETVRVTAKNKLGLFNPQQFAGHKSAGTYRIFCMGGSTTFGRPYDDTTSFCGWLRAMLHRADPSREWELINAGGISYASYRVAALMEELVRYEPDLFIIYSGHNEFLERRKYGRIINTPSAVRGLGAIMSRTRTYAVVKKAVDVLNGSSGGTAGERAYLPDEVETILGNSLGPQGYHRDTELRKQVLDHYRYNLIRMVDIAWSVGAKVFLVMPASNLRHCSPFKSEHRDGLSDADRRYWQTLFDHASKSYAANLWDETLTATDKAITIDDRYAHVHYLRGCALWELKRYDDAKTAFVRAMDEDVCPLRAPRPMLDIITEVASKRNVPVVDFAGLVERQSEHATPGEELFIDHVHPTIEGNLQLALALLEAMNKQGIVRLTSTWGDAKIKRLRQEVERHLDLKAHGIALRNLSRLFRWAGKFEEGRKLGLRATRMAPTDAEAHLLVGVNAIELGRLDEAISYFRQALKIKPDYAEAHSNLGLALAKQDGLDEAIGHYHQALQADPNYAHAYCNLGVAMSAKGQLEEAITYFRQALRIKPDYVEAYNDLGSVLVAQGRLDEAISHYRRALKIKPDYVHARYNLSSVLRSQGRLDEAISHFHQVLKIKPDCTEAHSNLADVLAEQDKLDEAISHYHQALQANPNNAHAHCNLGAAISSKGNLDEAAGHFRQALRIKPNYTEAHFNLGRVLVTAGQLNEALKHFREAAALNPNWPAPLNDIARILATHPDPKIQDVTEAVRFAERAAKLTKYQDVTILKTLAEAYAAASQFNRAVTTTQAAITLASAAQADELVNYLQKQLELYKQAKF